MKTERRERIERLEDQLKNLETELQEEQQKLASDLELLLKVGITKPKLKEIFAEKMENINFLKTLIKRKKELKESYKKIEVVKWTKQPNN